MTVVNVDRFCQAWSVPCLASFERQSHNVCQHWAPTGRGCRVLNAVVCEAGWVGLECKCELSWRPPLCLTAVAQTLTA